MTVYFGVDPTGGGHTTGDEFAWAAATRDGNKITMLLVKGRGRRGGQPFNLDSVVQECCADIRSYGASECLGDSYSQNWVVESFRRHAVKYVHSKQHRSELFLNLLPLVLQGTVEIPADPELLKQLKLLQRRPGPQGREIVEHPSGAHDDRAVACALAVAAASARRLEPQARVLGGAPRDAGVGVDLSTGQRVALSTEAMLHAIFGPGDE